MQIDRRSTLLSIVGLLAPVPGRGATPVAVADYERATGGHVGMYAENIATGAKLGWRADERFVMCSTFKASLAALVLHRVDRGEDDLQALIRFTTADVPDWYAPVAKANLAKGALAVADMCKAAVEQGDNTCANLLLERVGGPSALTSFWRRSGDGVSRLDDPEPFLNRVPLGDDRSTTTPRAMAGSLTRFVLGNVLSDRSRTLLKSWLLGSVTGADRLRAGLPGNWSVGDKTGSNGKDAAGDIAVAWPNSSTPIVVCVYTRGGTPSDAQFRAIFASMGELVAAQLA